MSNPEVLQRKHTRREFRERMQSGQLLACIIPVAAIEQHLEHLAMEHDWRSACQIAVAVAERLRPQVLVAEGLMAGISEHHMRHPGTLSLRPGTFLAVLADLIDSVVRAGFKNVLVLNGHGGNTAPIHGTWEQFLRMNQVNLHFLSYWDVLTETEARELLKSGHQLPTDLPGHAQEFENRLCARRLSRKCAHENVDGSGRPETVPGHGQARRGIHHAHRGTGDRLPAGDDGRKARRENPALFPMRFTDPSA